jgi:single-stranded DNA-specific DHH superfamily exonuclease
MITYFLVFMIPKEKINELKEELYSCVRPIFFFDDDPDGLCSFLQFYKAVGDGKGIPIKGAPVLDEPFAKKAIDFSPDKVFILDKAVVSQEFISSLNNTPIIWVDHHTPLNLKGNYKYYNPRLYTPDKQKPTSYWCYKACDNKKYLWIATVGCVADWFIPEFLDDFIKEYPHILSERNENPGYLFFETRLGILIKAFAFCLKGKTSDVLKCMKILTRIKSPDEILDSTTEQGKFIYKNYEKMNVMYTELLNRAKACATDDVMLVFDYKEDKVSFTAELSNELLHLYHDKVIVIARKKDDEMKCSLRSGKYIIEPILKEILNSSKVEGYGGGHEHACGACIKLKDFDTFIKMFRDMISKL